MADGKFEPPPKANIPLAVSQQDALVVRYAELLRNICRNEQLQIMS